MPDQPPSTALLPALIHRRTVRRTTWPWSLHPPQMIQYVTFTFIHVIAVISCFRFSREAGNTVPWRSRTLVAFTIGTCKSNTQCFSDMILLIRNQVINNRCIFSLNNFKVGCLSANAVFVSRTSGLKAIFASKIECHYVPKWPVWNNEFRKTPR